MKKRNKNLSIISAFATCGAIFGYPFIMDNYINNKYKIFL